MGTYDGPGYKTARLDALKRSRGKCQFCGLREATETHHWALHYPSDDQVTGDDLTALCPQCHEIATTQRRFVYVLERSPFEFMAIFREAVTQCHSTTPSSRASAPRAID